MSDAVAEAELALRVLDSPVGPGDKALANRILGASLAAVKKGKDAPKLKAFLALRVLGSTAQVAESSQSDAKEILTKALTALAPKKKKEK